MFCKFIYAIIVISYNFIGLVCYPANEYDGQVCGEGITKGTCKTVLECPVAQEALMQRRLPGLERCGFDGFIEVVCCPDAKTEVRAPGPRKSEIACKEFSNKVPGDPTLLILGGENAKLGEFPHMAALGYAYDGNDAVKWECGGSLISNRFVLTAAHCIIKRDGVTPTKIRLGIVDITGNDNVEPQDYGVMNITVHNEYNRGTKINDIALIKLDKDVSDSNNVLPACLYQRSANPMGLVITGWGYTTAGGDPSTILQKAKLHSVEGTQCSALYESRLARAIIASQICAVSDDGSKDTCQGDSGGPLQVQDINTSSIYSIVGVTSYGMACGGKTPGIYSRVSSYLDWIENIVWP